MTGPAPIYLDHAATTPVDPRVLEAMLPFLAGQFGNPSSVHGLGRAARTAVDAARDSVAAVIGCVHGEVVFTSGGTEANNLALRGSLDRWQSRGRHLVVSVLEHDSVLATARALEAAGRAELTVVACDPDGCLDPARVAGAVRPDTVAVSVMLVNNEIGSVQDVSTIAELARQRNPAVLVHTDAVQALGRLPVDLATLPVDLLSLSAHKLYGPKGVGALFARRGTLLASQLSGGGQERNRRSGTENVAGIVGLGTALELAASRRPAEAPRLSRLADRLTRAVLSALPDARVTGPPHERRAPGFATFALPGIRTDLLLAGLDRAGVCASGGSACSSGAPSPSHVLEAMGLPPELSAGALRCTLGRGTTEAEVEAAAAAIASVAERARTPAGYNLDHGSRN